jgi:hypothetical protein
MDMLRIYRIAPGRDNAPTASLEGNEALTGIRYGTDEKGRKVAVQIDLKKTPRR